MEWNTSRKIAVVTALGSWGLFFSSLFLPAFYYGGGNATDGWELLGIGWIGLLGFPLGLFGGELAWVANPLFAAMTGLMIFGRYKFATIFGGGSATLAASTFLLNNFGYSLIRERPITGYGVGFYLWLSAIALSLVASSALISLTAKKPPGVDPVIPSPPRTTNTARP